MENRYTHTRDDASTLRALALVALDALGGTRGRLRDSQQAASLLLEALDTELEDARP